MNPPRTLRSASCAIPVRRFSSSWNMRSGWCASVRWLPPDRRSRLQPALGLSCPGRRGLCCVSSGLDVQPRVADTASRSAAKGLIHWPVNTFPSMSVLLGGLHEGFTSSLSDLSSSGPVIMIPKFLAITLICSGIGLKETIQALALAAAA